jgi:hypothetical protein
VFGVRPRDTDEIEGLRRSGVLVESATALAFEEFIVCGSSVSGVTLYLEDDVVTLGVVSNLGEPEIGDVLFGSDDQDVIEENEDSTTVVERNPREEIVDLLEVFDW